MNAAQIWKSFFVDWPADLPRRGVVLSVLNDQTPFKDFWLQGELIMFDRTNPDTAGARYVMLCFDAVNSVKFVNPLSEATIAGAGFTANGEKRTKQLV